MREVGKYARAATVLIHSNQGDSGRRVRGTSEGWRIASITAAVLIVSLTLFLLLTTSLLVYGLGYQILTAPVGSRYHPRVLPTPHIQHKSHWP